jgi:hypothetical protein
MLVNFESFYLNFLIFLPLLLGIFKVVPILRRSCHILVLPRILLMEQLHNLKLTSEAKYRLAMFKARHRCKTLSDAILLAIPEEPHGTETQS